MTQPLWYQTKSSCWVTSMLNGILFLLEDIDQIPVLVPHIMYSILKDDLEDMGGTYHDNSGYIPYRHYYSGIIKCIEQFMNKHPQRASPQINIMMDCDASYGIRDKLAKLHFNRQIVVCDIHSSQHSILIHGKRRRGKELIYCGFDPYWNHVSGGEEIEHSYMTQPGDPRTNVLIYEEHLFVNVHGNQQNFVNEHKFKLGNPCCNTVFIIQIPGNAGVPPAT